MIDISIFNNNLFFEAGTEFFKQLGIRLNSNTAVSLGARELLKDQYKDKDIFRAITETYFLGLVDDSLFDSNASLLSKDKISLKEAAGKINAEYNGLMVFAVKLPDSYSPKRSDIADLTRAFNRVSKNIPVVLLLKYGNLLSFAACERTRYKQEYREGEKIGKISLLKDINTDSPHTGHLKILYDLKVKPKVTDFNALYKQWQEVFNINLLNKKFYQELFYWYLWAVKKVKFPQTRPKEDLIPNEAHQSESVIRLLTRLLFCWFMKEKQELIPEHLFDKREVKKILTDFSTENEKSSVFYRAILQNLFFATLSVPIKNRKYIRESFQGKNRDYGNQYVYRYQSEFVNAKENLKLFKDIPFLNGGLFECLDEAPENNNDKEIRLDGFSSKEKKQAFVPDYLFWDEHRGIDLSEELGNPRKKNETVLGIIDILNSYKFTIEENTPLEEEIALDPELLGKVFESLLAYYTPETKANARKQTGSFYTPREIVNYMVDEALIAAFQQKLSDAGITDNVDQRLRDLISYNETDISFTEKETNVIIQALENLKILDPACGSGAFPMGILHKLVWILQKVDHENKIWFESIIKRLPDYAQPEMRKKLEGENWDYLRKLGIIQQSVYGVDIQPIAIQIAKLRFFISLLVDQDIKGNAGNNFGLQPLPNLDFKLVSANTLIGAPEQNQQNDGKLFFAQDEFFDKFNALTGQYFGTYEPAEKKKLTKKIEKLVSGKVQEKVDEIQRLSTHTDERFSKHVAEKNKALIEQKKNDAKLWESYNNLFKHESVGFFETKYFFPEVKEGFDVVIGNPPYISHDKITNKHEIKKNYLSYEPFADIYCYFIECAINLQNENGIFTYITSNSYLRSDYGKPIRKLIAQENSILNIVNIEDSQVFECAIVNVAIIIAANSKKNKKKYCHVVNSQYDGHTSFTDFVQTNGFDYPQEVFTDKIWNLIEPELYNIQKKIESDYKTLEQLGSKIRLGLATGNNKAFIIDDAQKEELRKLQQSNAEIIKPILRGRDILRFSYKLPGLYILLTKNGIDVKNDYPYIYKHLKSFGDNFKRRGAKGQHWTNLRACSFFDDFKKEKIVWIELTDIGRFALCTEEIYLLNSAYFLLPPKDINVKYLLGVLNSRIIKFYLSIIAETSGMGTSRWINNFVKEFPIPLTSQELRSSIITLVDQILTAKQNDPSTDTSALEKKIDEMVYKLYGLDYEEVKIIDPEFEMTEKDYTAFSMPQE